MKSWVAAVLAFALSGCATTYAIPPRNLSGVMQPAPPLADGVLVGFLADSQLQTRTNNESVPGYRGLIEDWAVSVSIRPPALDWASRAMLQSDLNALAAKGVKAVFYLGDGANNGCHDELAAGFDPASPVPADKDLGLLAVLDKFRTATGIPVFFILGNHDLLGAGSTSKWNRRKKFCRDAGDTNRALTKGDVIRLANRFNVGNSAIKPEWLYRSSYNDEAIKRNCDQKLPAEQHTSWGCYLAATVDYAGGGTPVQFLLLDSNDWANVTHWHIGGWEQLGVWGAMSFGPAPDGAISQIDWFKQNAASPVPMRVALAHYNVPSLQKKLPVVGAVSRLADQLADLFTSSGAPRIAHQTAAFVITAHTHNPRHGVAPARFRVGCRGAGCEPRQLLYVTELNIGSTTDYSNYATVAELRPSRNAVGEIRFERVETEPQGCDDVYAELSSTTFDTPVEEQSQGMGALGLSMTDRHNYWRYSFKQMKDVWANMKEFAPDLLGTDVHRAACVGRLAAQIEAGPKAH